MNKRRCGFVGKSTRIGAGRKNSSGVGGHPSGFEVRETSVGRKRDF
jgi:hypothetical protein